MAKKQSLKHNIIILCALALLAGGAYALYLHSRPNVPSERQMARIMADLYMADAILQEIPSRGPKDKTIENTYHSILAHYNLSKLQYDSAMAFYARNPSKMSAVYERTIAILSEREEQVKTIANIADSTAKAINAINDSLTHSFQAPSTILLPLIPSADSLKKYLLPSPRRYDQVTLNIPLDSLQGGHIDVSHRYTVTKALSQTPKAFMRILITYADSTTSADSIRLDAYKRVTQRAVELSSTLRDSIPAVHASISLYRAKGLKDMAITLREIKLSYKPYDVVDTTNYDNLLPSLFAY